jgi:DNA-binding GntR family transcriptional regulator
MHFAPEKPELGLPVLVAEQLKQLIYSGELKPGVRLNEEALTLRMGTSRSPVRQAIRLLTGLGLVKAVLNRGVFMQQLSVRGMLGFYDLRALVSGLAVERATHHIAESHKVRFKGLLDGMDQACEAEKPYFYHELNLQFHGLVLQLANNQQAQAAYDDYFKEMQLFGRECLYAPDNMRQSNAEHPTLCEAVVKGSKAKAKTTAERHVLKGRDRLLSNIDVLKGFERAMIGLVKLKPEMFWLAILVATAVNNLGGVIRRGMGRGIHHARMGGVMPTRAYAPWRLRVPVFPLTKVHP